MPYNSNQPPSNPRLKSSASPVLTNDQTYENFKAVRIRSAIAAVVCAGLIAGTLDVGIASLIGWHNPLLILQAIASGLFGRSSFTGGWGTALLGILLQWAMSLLIAAIYVVAASKISYLQRHWKTMGFFYGVVIYLVMTFVVVPISAVPFKRHFGIFWIMENLLAMLIFGLIISYWTQLFLRSKN